MAQDVLATTWVGYAHAMVSDDRAALTAYTTPSALDVSIATLDCGCLSGPMTYSTTAISTPPQRTYPLSFMAGLSGLGYNQQSQTWWVVFRKAAAAAPWVIAFIAGYTEGNGLDGFESNSAPSPMSVHYPLPDAPQAYANYFQHLDATGDLGDGAPTDFAKDNILNYEVSSTAELDARRKAAGFHQTFTHAVDQVSAVFAQVADGSLVGSMECFSMKLTDDVTSATGAPIVQPADQQVWGYLIPPGSFASISFTSEDDVCVEEDAVSGITVTADSGSAYAIATTPSG